MKKTIYILLALLILCSCSKKKVPQETKEIEIIEEVREDDFIETEDYDIVKNNSIFAFNLYSQAGQGSDNFLMSPFSISAALAMTYAGAKQMTEIQMSEVLRFTRHKDQVNYGFRELIHDLEGHQSAGVKLNIANSIWAQEDHPFLEDYLTVLKKEFGSEMYFTDYKGKTEQSRLSINSWVEKKTEDKIKNLIKDGMLSASTKLVLVNAIYFNAAWKTPFEKENSYDGDFYPTKSTTSEARYMVHDEIGIRYFENSALQLIELPYKENRFSMIVILPSKDKNMADFEKTLTFDNYTQWLNEARPKTVKVILPKFTFSYDMELSEQLKSMGMPLAFSDEADFSGMTGKKDLKIDKVVHKAFIDVSEWGTEAAAATAVIMAETTAPYRPEPIPVFKADHPFIFMIRHNESGTILFTGRLMKSSKS